MQQRPKRLPTQPAWLRKLNLNITKCPFPTVLLQLCLMLVLESSVFAPTIPQANHESRRKKKLGQPDGWKETQEIKPHLDKQNRNKSEAADKPPGSPLATRRRHREWVHLCLGFRADWQGMNLQSNFNSNFNFNLSFHLNVEVSYNVTLEPYPQRQPQLQPQHQHQPQLHLETVTVLFVSPLSPLSIRYKGDFRPNIQMELRLRWRFSWSCG